MSNKIKLEITVDEKGAVTSFRNLADSANKSGKDMERGLSGPVAKIKENWLAASATIYAAWGTINQAWDLAKAGADFKEQEGLLNNLARKYYSSSGEIIAAMGKASEGLVADADLMQFALGGISKGLKPEELTNLADAARILGDAAGKDATAALEDLTEALSTGKTKGLKGYLGTAIDLETVFGDLTGKMTEAERVQALYSITMIEANRLQGEQTTKVDDTADAIERLEAKWKNLRSAVGQSLAGMVGAFLGTAEEEEQERLAKARLAYMGGHNNIDYASISKLSVKDQNKYIDTLIAAEDLSMSEGRRFGTGAYLGAYQAELNEIKRNVGARNTSNKTGNKSTKAAVKEEIEALEELGDENLRIQDAVAAYTQKKDAEQLESFYDSIAAEKKMAERYQSDWEDINGEMAYADGRYLAKSVDNTEKAINKKKGANETFFDGIQAGLNRSLQYERDWAFAGEQIFEGFHDSTKGIFSDLINDGWKGDLKDFEDYFKSFTGGMVRTVADTAAEMATQQITEAAVSGIAKIGGWAGGAALDWLADTDWLGNWKMHAGAYYVGQDQTNKDRLRNDEYLRILQRGEMVLPADIAEQVRGGDFSGLAAWGGGETTSVNPALADSFMAGLGDIGKEGAMQAGAGLAAGMSPAQVGAMAAKGALSNVIGLGFDIMNTALLDAFNVDIHNDVTRGSRAVLGTVGAAKFGPLGGYLGDLFGALLGSIAHAIDKALGISLEGRMEAGWEKGMSLDAALGGYATTHGVVGGSDFGLGFGNDPSGESGYGGADSGGPGGGPGSAFKYGGISVGPDSGYPITVHGREAHVPLPNGRSIPVEITSGGAGKSSDIGPIHIHLNLDGREFASAMIKQARTNQDYIISMRRIAAG